MTGDEQAVWDAMRSVYAAFVTGDSAAVDAVMDEGVTLWDSAEEGLVRGLDGLAALRARRPAHEAHAPAMVGLDARDPLVDVWGEVALLRHVLHVRYDDGRVEVVRNTSVWRRRDGRWWAVHNHEDVVGGM